MDRPSFDSCSETLAQMSYPTERQMSYPTERQMSYPTEGQMSYPTRVRCRSRSGSDVVVHRELVGMRAQTDRIHLVLTLVLDPRFDEIVGEHTAGLEECVI